MRHEKRLAVAEFAQFLDIEHGYLAVMPVIPRLADDLTLTHATYGLGQHGVKLGQGVLGHVAQHGQFRTKGRKNAGVFLADFFRPRTRPHDLGEHLNQRHQGQKSGVVQRLLGLVPIR